MTKDADFDRIFNTLPADNTVVVSEAESRRARRSEARPPRQTGRSIFALVMIAVLAIGGSGVWLLWNEYGVRIVNYFAQEEVLDFEGSGAPPTIEIVINPGEIGETVARRLAEEGVTASFEAVYEVLLRDTTITFQPGTYQMLTGMSAESAIGALRDPANRVQISFVIPEGVTMERALEIIAQEASLPLEDLQQATQDPAAYGVANPANSLEGYLFPATYTFEPGVEATDIIARMVEETKSRLTGLGVAPEQWHEVLALAALVQREARATEDFYKASRVFTNRLDIGMALQSDATVTYWTGLYDSASTTDADRADPDNPYNTYYYTGLPLGPISLPGEVAMDAALNPAAGDWLYFVAIDLRTGETVFSNTFAEHERAVQRWLSWCRESEENGAYC